MNKKNKTMKKWMTSILVTVNILLYFIVIALWISIPDETGLNLFVGGFTLVMSALLILLNRQRFYIFYTSSYFQKMISAFLSIVLVMSILGFINYLSYKNGKVWDVTKEKKNSLTSQSYQVLDSVGKGLRVRVFAQKKSFDVIRYFLELYRLHKNDIEIEYQDAEIHPESVKRANITKIPSIEVSYGSKRKVIESITEKDLTNAIVLVTQKNKGVVYFVTGHGEIDLFSNENEGASYLLSLLEGKALNIKTLDLKEVHAIPSDADVLIFWGSKDGFFGDEVELLKKYIEGGGHVLFAFDPDFNGKGQVELKKLLREKGLEVHNDLVIDKIKYANGSKGTIPVIHKYDPNHPITKDFKGPVFLPLASSLKDIPSQSGLRPSWHLLGVSNHFPGSWGDISRDELVDLNLKYSKGRDYKGPLGYFASYERKLKGRENKEIRMVVFGNSTFVINAYKKFSQNFILFSNTLNWLVGEERLISFNIPGIEDRPIFMTKGQIGIIFYFSVILCPLFLLFIAFLIYRRRRHL